MATESLRFCSPCSSETWFETVEFDDGFGDDSEMACVDCGHAIVLGHVGPEHEVALLAA